MGEQGNDVPTPSLLNLLDSVNFSVKHMAFFFCQNHQVGVTVR